MRRLMNSDSEGSPQPSREGMQLQCNRSGTAAWWSPGGGAVTVGLVGILSCPCCHHVAARTYPLHTTLPSATPPLHVEIDRWIDSKPNESQSKPLVARPCSCMRIFHPKSNHDDVHLLPRPGLDCKFLQSGHCSTFCLYLTNFVRLWTN